ncbi:MAG: single-stranded-DNA-specific exonuclease RecJ [Dehalococcoidia bacterium]|nr:single-stranded-DNA-specific exonuclease RecJ [Dehalococcoidia bacterium]
MTATLVRPTPRWRLRKAGAEQIYRQNLSHLPPIVGKVLAARGIDTREKALAFYKPHLAPDLDPFRLTDMRRAIDRTRAAIAGGETIALYGDYDADGVTSLATLTRGMRPLGAITLPFIPSRFKEGYGLNSDALTGLRDAGASLVITADCGISNVSEVEHANSLGLDVVILDHHTVPPETPAAHATVNPMRLDSPDDFRGLAAVGVVFHFLRALYEDFGRSLDESELLATVALGTVVDVAPLRGENRRITRLGLEAMHSGLPPGLEALMSVSRQKGAITTDTFGYALGPRINAAGRMEHARHALDLMLSDSIRESRELAERLDAMNRQRQEETDRCLAIAEELVGNADDPLIMVGSDEFRLGIVGLIAGRLAESRSRPAIAYCPKDDFTATASARSIPQFDIVSAIRKEASLVEKHGGHRAAAGFTVRNENIPDLHDRLVNTAAELLDADGMRPIIEVDAEVSLRQIAGNEIRGLMQFEPCGEGNPRPVLLARGVALKDFKTVGADKGHLKMQLKDGAATWPAIAFRQADAELDGEVDVVVRLQNGWMDDRLELEVLDVAPASAGRPLETP